MGAWDGTANGREGGRGVGRRGMMRGVVGAVPLVSALALGAGGAIGSARAAQGRAHGGGSDGPSPIARDLARLGLALIGDFGGPERNAAASPVSLASALCMVGSGGSDEAQDAILQALMVEGPNGTADGANTEDPDAEAAEGALAPFAGRLSTDVRMANGDAAGDDMIDLAVSNAAWVRGDTRLNRYARTAIETWFDATVEVLSDDAPEAQINAWVAEATRERITQLVDRVPRGGGLVLTNAVAFDGRWRFPFDPEATTDQPFLAVGGAEPSVPMMHAEARTLTYRNGDGLRAVELPFGGGSFRLTLVTHEERTAEDAGRLLTIDPDWLVGVGYRRVSVAVALPHVLIEAGGDITESLADRGLRPALNTPSAFGDLATPAPAMVQIAHKAMVRWDETGAEAAAATAVLTDRSLTEMAPPLVFDRPFLFSIRHTPTGLPLFTGLVADPSA